jgi:F-type H+-transporting ATPase subunit b
MIINETFLVAVATVLFVGLIFKPIRKLIVAALDRHTAEAIKNLNEANKMYEDALHLYNAIKQQHQEAQQNVKDIIAKAKEEAEVLISEASQEVERITKKKSELAMARIVQQEKHIMEFLKDAIINDAIIRVQTLVAQELDMNAQLSMLESNIKQATKKLVN